MDKKLINSVLADRQIVDEIRNRTAGTRSLPRARSFGLRPETFERAIETPEMFETRPITEAIVLLFGRPSLLIRNDTFEVPDSDVWRGRLLPARSRLEQAIRSVGRVEVINHFSFQWLGSCFMIDRQIAVTNRHVAAEFARKTARGFVFSQNFLGQTHQARIDYREEHLRDEPFEVGVRRVLFMSEDDPTLPDVAFLELEEAPELPTPLNLLQEAIEDPNRFIAAIGYPARDFRNPADAMEQVFGDVFDVKRLSPGSVIPTPRTSGLPEFVFLHNCSTLGGSSGCPLIDLNTGAVAGLHFGGQFREANFAVRASEVLRALEGLSTRPPREPRREQEPIAHEDTFSIERPAGDYENREGYDPSFLGDDFEIPHPELSPALEQEATQFPGADGQPTHILPYTHFSVVMHQTRRLAMYTACNISGESLRHIPRGGDKWYFDPRIDRLAQIGNDLYRDNDLDRGHLVRRLDPVWGDPQDAHDANEDTFHWTNCSPQHAGFNQKTWLGLEEYILDNADAHDLKLCVFTGPIFDQGDPEYRGVRLPRQYWKVIAMVREESREMLATAYVISQADLISNIEFAFGPFRTYQVPIQWVEEHTGLAFPALRPHDPQALIETVAIRPLADLSEIRF